MQTFRKRYSQLFLIASLLISSFYITACDTSEDDVLEPIQELTESSVSFSKAENMALCAIDLVHLFKVSTATNVILTANPSFGTVEINEEGLLLYRANDSNNPKTDEFGYRLNGKDGKLQIAYTPDSVTCEVVTQEDIYYTQKNTALYSLDFMSNDILCNTESEMIYIEEIEGSNSIQEGIEIFFEEGTTKINYFPPSNFVGRQDFLYYIRPNDSNNSAAYVGKISFEVSANTDTTCVSSLQNDLFIAADLPTFFSPFERVVGIENDSTNTVPFESVSYEVDSLYFNDFVVGQTYYYLPYLENDSICDYSSFDWELSVDWNGITGATHALGQYPFYKPVFFVATDTPLPFSFFYTLRNRITGEEHTAEVVVN
ncbi:hypothetical protein WAF17_07790 [Bernardetia sp. ABR2-2B]|uniref:hypothetical protein n=1 Tax=Bernardetia sp. ABR2-2B TaxID=3127472 RepID=UPI0030CE585E